MKNKNWYQKSWRRMLIDMHIPDWEKEFLSKYEPEEIAEQYGKAGLQSVMFYNTPINLDNPIRWKNGIIYQKF